jgi:hypothetical protein
LGSVAVRNSGEDCRGREIELYCAARRHLLVPEANCSELDTLETIAQ